LTDGTEIDWTLFLGRAAGGLDPQIAEEFLRGKRVLITGAGGSIGSALAMLVAGAGVKRLVALDVAEHGLFELGAALDEEAASARAELVVGDVCDRALLRAVFAEHRPEVVFHAAACKHVSLMEANPFAAARTNIAGTHGLLQASREARVGQVIVVSTDKAADPAGIMGATKRVAELLVLASESRGGGPTKVKAVRLANVLGSSGSVAPTFARQIARGGPLTITDPACTRYFLSMEEAVGHLVSALGVDGSSTVLVPELGGPSSILELARFMLGTGEAKMVHAGLRAGEKVTEQMVASEESLRLSNVPGLRVVVPKQASSAAALDFAMPEIDGAIEERGLGRLLTAIMALVPAYRPSRQILERTG
jgi:FlaA1/EpsC-like NDP-sugar epimerase